MPVVHGKGQDIADGLDVDEVEGREGVKVNLTV
jgi:hypothetical protein